MTCRSPGLPTRVSIVALIAAFSVCGPDTFAFAAPAPVPIRQYLSTSPAAPDRLTANPTLALPLNQAPSPSPSPPTSNTARDQRNAAIRRQHATNAARAAQAEWVRAGKPPRLIIVRPRNIDIVTDGQLSTRMWRRSGVMTLATLAASAPTGWVATSGDSAQLSAVLLLTRGTTVDPGVRTLRLSEGADPAAAASIRVGSGTLNLHDITVASINPVTGQVPPVSAAGRPFIVVGAGGRLNATDTAVNELGTAAPEASDQAGLVFSPGSTGSLVRTSIRGNYVGLTLSGSVAVHLDTVTVARSSGDGLVLRGDRETVMRAVRSTGNDRNGVLIYGTAVARTVSGIDTSSNGDYGIAVIRQDNLTLNDVSSTADRGGGLRLTGCTNCSTSGVTVVDDTVGVLVNGSSTRVKLMSTHVSGGAQGLVVAHGVSGVDIEDARIEGAAVSGVNISASNVVLRALIVSYSTTAVKLTGAAHDITLTAPVVYGGWDGLVIGATVSQVTLLDPEVTGVSNDGVITSLPGLRISGGRIYGGVTGINARAATVLDGTSVGRVNEGIHVGQSVVGQSVVVRGNRIDVNATTSGIKVDPGAEFVLADSRIRAREALRGDVTRQGNNYISPPQFPWLRSIGVLVIVVALALQLIYVTRFRRFRRSAPARILSGGLPQTQPSGNVEAAANVKAR
jgi:hypothetical protein